MTATDCHYLLIFNELLGSLLSPSVCTFSPHATPPQGFGDVFVCRIAGNIATAEEIASLEYAVLELGVKVILVMGHTSCGAVKAALSGEFKKFCNLQHCCQYSSLQALIQYDDLSYI